MSFVAATRAGDNQSSTVDPLSITIPSSGPGGSVVAGHIAVLTVEWDGSATLTTPSGWTLHRNETGAGSPKASIFIKQLVGGDPGAGVSLDFSGPVRCGATMKVYSGRTLTGLVSDVVATSSATGSYTLPTVTGVPAGADLDVSVVRRRSGVSANSIDFSGTPYSLPGGTSPSDAGWENAYGAGVNTFGEGAYRENVAAGSYGGESPSTSLSSIGYTFIVVLPAAPTAQAASLSGSGSLTALASAPTASQSAALSGSGTLSATDVPGYARSAALSGSGTLAATGLVGFARSAVLAGNGTLEGAAAPGFVIAIGYSGVGELQASGLGTASALLAGSGDLAGFPFAPAVFMAAVLSGSGALSTAIRSGFTAVAVFSGSGSLTALGLITPREAALSGTGYLTTFGQNLLRLGTTIPITFRLGTTMPSKLYLGDLLVWKP